MTILTSTADNVYTLNAPIRTRSSGRITRAIRAKLFDPVGLIKEAWEIDAWESAKHRSRRRTNLQFKRSAQSRAL